MLTHSSYTQYFDDIARRHKQLAHTDTAKHFARIVLNVDEMGQDNVKEFIAGLRGKLKTPFLLLVAYDHSYQDNLGDNKRKVVSGAFILLEVLKEGDFDYQEAVYEKLERIGEEILAYMEWEFRQPEALRTRRLDLSSVTGEKIGKVDNYFGGRFSFSYSINANGPLFHNPQNWNL